jgi:DNA-binding Xre family transcriptional regulator
MPTISYNKLWKLLIDKKMNKKDLRLAAGVSTAVIAKLGKGDNVTTDVLLKICTVLDCDIAEIMEIEKENIYHNDIGANQLAVAEREQQYRRSGKA